MNANQLLQKVKFELHHAQLQTHWKRNNTFQELLIIGQVEDWLKTKIKHAKKRNKTS
jgi:hypothetical protein